MKKLDYVAYYISITFAILRMLMVVGGIGLVKVEQFIWIGMSTLLLFCIKKEWEDKSKLM